jgi:hypothetical protein
MITCFRMPARFAAQLACLLLFAAPLLATAAPVRWALADAKFADGGAIVGSFVYDATTNTVSDWSVSVAGGATASFPAVTYNTTTGTANAQPLADPQTSVLFFLNGSQRVLRITPVTDFTNAGGTIAINTNTGGGQSGGVECYNCGPARVITAGSFIGTPLGPGFSLTRAVSGNWYDPAQDGHGFQLEALPNGLVTAFWFTFDNAGNVVWINAAGQMGATTIEMQAIRVLNGRFPPNFNPATVTRVPWGSLTFTFTDCDHGSVTWNSIDPAFTATGTMPLQRLTRLDGLNCVE